VDTKLAHGPDRPTGELHHEVRDVHVRPIVLSGVGLFALVIVSIGLMWWLFEALERQEEAVDTKPTGIMAERPKEPPQPRLQTSPVPALRQILASENGLLSSYGWINEKTGTVRIPVQRAMELLAERGLPARVESRQQSAVSSQLRASENLAGSGEKRGDGDSAPRETRAAAP
jgi:hypothetical protein